MKSAEKIAKRAEETGDAKPLARYSRRTRSVAQKKHWAEIPKSSRRKPLQAIRLSRRAHYAVVREWDAIATEAQLYKEAFTAKLYSLCWQMRENTKDRLFGKAFTATNPADTDKINAIFNDNRLQIGIQQLLPTTQGDKQTTHKLPIQSKDNDTIESTG